MDWTLETSETRVSDAGVESLQRLEVLDRRELLRFAEVRVAPHGEYEAIERANARSHGCGKPHPAQ